MPEEQIAFDVETGRVLEILSKEIYDSPYALLRENLQNAYDAVLMRCAAQDVPLDGRSIRIEVNPGSVMIEDDGIGMTEDVLRHNFWKAGSSGKKTELATRAGVVGTFGIGAMANFGVCKRLRIETRAIDSNVTLVSTAIRDELKIGRDCISLERIADDRAPGTKLMAELDDAINLSVEDAGSYLRPFVRFLPVKVTLNGDIISREDYEQATKPNVETTVEIADQVIDDGVWAAELRVLLDAGANVTARLSRIRYQGDDVAGELFLVQQSGQLTGYRNYFGLAAIPITSYYQFGGVANLGILQPTAGREALSRESIDHVNHLVRLSEIAITRAIAPTEAADRNRFFLEHVQALGQTELAERVKIDVLPEGVAVELGELVNVGQGGRTIHYYGGQDQSIIQTFASGESSLLRLSQSNPRRSLQHSYVTGVLGISEVPDRPTITKTYEGPDLSMGEVATLLRITTTLAEDYLLHDVDVRFADISHGVAVLVERDGHTCRIFLTRDSSILHPVLECHRTAYEAFGGFVKDFVRVHLYQRIADFVPSSTREGADALLKVLQRNRELYRYEETEFGTIDPLLAEYLAGEVSFSEVIQASVAAGRPYTQTVTSAQVGRIEDQLPDIVGGPAPTAEEIQQQFGAAPPILRTDANSDMKVLFAHTLYPQLNSFQLFLGLSDRLFKRDGTFFQAPHTTKVIWGSHRVIYMFRHASAQFTLYYDIELKAPLDDATAGGGSFPTTTIITRNRIFVPVPSDLMDAFRVTEGAKEFYVRFDTLTDPT